MATRELGDDAIRDGHPVGPTTPAAAGPKCYACAAEATTRCMWCNALSCAVHVQSVNVLSGRNWSTALLCPTCHAQGKKNLQSWQILPYLCVTVFVIALIFGYFLIGFLIKRDMDKIRQEHQREHEQFRKKHGFDR